MRQMQPLPEEACRKGCGLRYKLAANAAPPCKMCGYDGKSYNFCEFSVILTKEAQGRRISCYRFSLCRAILRSRGESKQNTTTMTVFTFVINTFRKDRKTQVFRFFRVPELLK